MCRELHLALLHVATLRICNFEITNELAKCCALLTAYIQISDSLSIFLNCELIKASNLFTLASLTGRCPSQMQVASLSTYTPCRWPFSWWLPTELCMKSPLHRNHRFRFMLPQHTFQIPFSINAVLSPMMIKPGNSSSTILEHDFLFSRPSTITLPSCAFQYGGNITLKLSIFNVFNLHLQSCASSYFL